MCDEDLKEVICILGAFVSTVALSMLGIIAITQYFNFKVCTEYGTMQNVEVKYIYNDMCYVKHNGSYQERSFYEYDIRNK